MRAFLLSLVALAAIAIGADWALDRLAFSSADRASGAAVNLGGVGPQQDGE